MGSVRVRPDRWRQPAMPATPARKCQTSGRGHAQARTRRTVRSSFRHRFCYPCRSGDPARRRGRDGERSRPHGIETNPRDVTARLLRSTHRGSGTRPDYRQLRAQLKAPERKKHRLARSRSPPGYGKVSSDYASRLSALIFARSTYTRLEPTSSSLKRPDLK